MAIQDVSSRPRTCGSISSRRRANRVDAVDKFIAAVSGRWPPVILDLESLPETGSAVVQEPYLSSTHRALTFRTKRAAKWL
jgi:hypothetical protein